jgi:hypothetical protein
MTAFLRRTTTVSVFGLLTLSGAAQGPPPTLLADQTASTIQELEATRQFEERVTEYVMLHRLLEGPLPPLQPTTDMAAVRANMRLLASRIRVVRQNARQGDIITPAVGRLFKHRIAKCLSPEDWAALFADIDADREGRPMPPVDLQVNMDWPVGIPIDFVSPQLLKALPRLPPELQYRIIGRTLVLWDHHADLIVDFLPRAFTT